MESAGEAQDGTATPVAASVAGAASAPPCPGFASPAAHQEHWPSAVGTSVLTHSFIFSVLPELALKAHVEMLEQPF